MIIGVTGGKGGTGKSLIATSLASALAVNHKVLLFDADVDCPNDHLLLSIKRELFKRVEQFRPVWSNKCVGVGACANACSRGAIQFIKGKPVFFDELCDGCMACFYSCPNHAINAGSKIIGSVFTGFKGNITLVSAELIAGLTDASFLIRRTKSLFDFDEFDFVIIDTGAGAHCNVSSALRGVDLALLVTEPTPFGVHDLSVIKRLVELLGIPYKVVLNKAGLSDLRVSADFVIPFSEDVIKSYVKGESIILPGINKLISELL